MDTGYRCVGCGLTGVKLWRMYQRYADEADCRCARCLGVHGVDDRGCVIAQGVLSDQIAPWRVPAIPIPGGTFWGYSSVPDDAVAAWRALKTYRRRRMYRGRKWSKQ